MFLAHQTIEQGLLFSNKRLFGFAKIQAFALPCDSGVPIGLPQAGDRTRTGDVQLGKLTFYH